MKLKEMKTDRLTLREMNMDDWKDYVSHVVEADEIFLQYGCEACEELLDEIQEPTPGVIYYSISITKKDQRIGYIGILEKGDNIEFHIYKGYRNHHYCTEALKAFLGAYLNGEMTGEKHELVFGETLSNNKPSCRVLENAGFKKEGIGFGFSIDEETEKISCQSARRIYLYKEE